MTSDSFFSSGANASLLLLQRMISKMKPVGAGGIQDATHRVVGTTFRLRDKRIGKEERENWLARLLTPRSDFRIHELQDIALTVNAGLAAREKQRKERTHGGDFYRTATVRIGKRFGQAVARAAAEGRLLYRDASRLTGLKGETFDRFAALALGGGEA